MALLDDIVALLNTLAFVVDGSVRANWGANIAVSDHKAGWALGEPLLLARFAVAASLLLTISSPE